MCGAVQKCGGGEYCPGGGGAVQGEGLLSRGRCSR